MRRVLSALSAIFGLLLLAPAGVMAASAIVPMKEKGTNNYYVDVHLTGFGRLEYLVDTGAGYMTIDEETLAVLQASDSATYVKRLQGVLADGSTLIVPVYRVGSINIGGSCMIQDVEVAVFPGKGRSLLGLSVLGKAAPFLFSMEPPRLKMRNCIAPAAPPADNRPVDYERPSSVPPSTKLVRASESAL
jgi:hypothetical protein